jgi:hypothetical protein
MEAAGYSEMLVPTYQTIRYHILEDLNLKLTTMRISNLIYSASVSGLQTVVTYPMDEAVSNL